MADGELALLQEEIAQQRRPTQWSVEGYRERFESWSSQYPPAPDLGIERFEFGGVDVYKVEAPNARSDHHIVYFHGGGYVACSALTHQVHVGNLSRATRATVWNVDYRLAPEHPFPAAPNDTVQVFRELVARGLIEPQRTILAGESAGGGLVVATMMILRDAGERLPAGGACLSPWFDLACTGESLVSNQATDLTVRLKGLQRTAKLYLGDHEPTDPLASPLYGDLVGLPPLLIQVATSEILLSDSLSMAERAEAADVTVQLEPWTGAVHFWQGFTENFALARRATAAIADFMDCCIEGRLYVSPQLDGGFDVDIEAAAEVDADLTAGLVDLAAEVDTEVDLTADDHTVARPQRP